MNALLQKIVVSIINPIIQVAFVVALLIFIYGVFEFIRGAERPDVRSTGQQHMLYGLVGLFIMTSVFTIIKILLNTIGVTGSSVPTILQ